MFVEIEAPVEQVVIEVEDSEGVECLTWMQERVRQGKWTKRTFSDGNRRCTMGLLCQFFPLEAVGYWEARPIMRALVAAIPPQYPMLRDANDSIIMRYNDGYDTSEQTMIDWYERAKLLL